MLVCFGISWPFNISKSCKSRTARGKSILFEVCVAVGYCCGIAARLVDADAGNDGRCWGYLLDMALVSTDLSLYFHYLRKNRRGEGGVYGHSDR